MTELLRYPVLGEQVPLERYLCRRLHAMATSSTAQEAGRRTQQAPGQEGSVLRETTFHRYHNDGISLGHVFGLCERSSSTTTFLLHL